MTTTHWIIRGVNEIDPEDGQLYWSNTFGWTTRAEADRYPEPLTRTFGLPMGGAWERDE